MTYYLVSEEYIGTDLSQERINSYAITTKSPRRTKGWLGTINDWSHYAHGEFDTEELARAEVKRLLADDYRELFACTDDEVARFAVGADEQVDAETDEGGMQ